MLEVSLARLKQGHRTLAYPAEAATLPDRFRGLPEIDASKCLDGCRACAEACPTNAISIDSQGSVSHGGHPLYAGPSPCHTPARRFASALGQVSGPRPSA